MSEKPYRVLLFSTLPNEYAGEEEDETVAKCVVEIPRDHPRVQAILLFLKVARMKPFRVCEHVRHGGSDAAIGSYLAGEFRAKWKHIPRKRCRKGFDHYGHDELDDRKVLREDPRDYDFYLKAPLMMEDEVSADHVWDIVSDWQDNLREPEKHLCKKQHIDIIRTLDADLREQILSLSEKSFY